MWASIFYTTCQFFFMSDKELRLYLLCCCCCFLNPFSLTIFIKQMYWHQHKLICACTINDIPGTEGAFLQPQSQLSPLFNFAQMKLNIYTISPGTRLLCLSNTHNDNRSNISQDWVQWANCQNKHKMTYIFYCSIGLDWHLGENPKEIGPSSILWYAVLCRGSWL